MDLSSQPARPTKYVTTTCSHKTAAPTHAPYREGKRAPRPTGLRVPSLGDSVHADRVCDSGEKGAFGPEHLGTSGGWGTGDGVDAGLLPLPSLSCRARDSKATSACLSQKVAGALGELMSE